MDLAWSHWYSNFVDHTLYSSLIKKTKNGNQFVDYDVIWIPDSWMYNLQLIVLRYIFTYFYWSVYYLNLNILSDLLKIF